MHKTIVVSGVGVISAIGNNSDENLASLKQKKTGIGSIELLNTVHKDEFKVGEIKFTNKELMTMAGLDYNDYKYYTRTALLAIIAAKEAVKDAKLTVTNKTGLVSATTVGGMDKTELEISDPAAVDFISTHPCGDSTDKVCRTLGILGYRSTISTACSSGTNAIIHAIRLIDAGIVDQVVVGGVDALSKFTLNGFNSLMILDPDFCKPFDQDRKGLNLGEGAGFIVIESSQSAEERGVSPICKITGCANSNDAYHQTASSPDGDGAYSAMTEALNMSGLLPSQIDYVNVHGTGTNNNDQSEGVALKRVFGMQMPRFSSTKAFTGHTLGAAAGIEAVFSVLSIKEGIVYPNLNFKTPIEGFGLSPQTEVEELEVQHVLSNSFGFGGNNSSVIFSK